MFKHILVPTDGSPLSREAISFAIAFAKQIGARITAFHAKPETRVNYYVQGMRIDDSAWKKSERLAEEASQDCLTYVEDLCLKAGLVCTKVIQASDTPYKAIIDVATQKGCDLIFMASHGHRGFGGLLIGSETSKVLTHTKIPVLVYR